MKSINPNGLATSQNKKQAPTQTRIPQQCRIRLSMHKFLLSMVHHLERHPMEQVWVFQTSITRFGNMAAMATAGIPTIATPNSGASSSSAGSSSQSSSNLPDVSAPIIQTIS